MATTPDKFMLHMFDNEHHALDAVADDDSKASAEKTAVQAYTVNYALNTVSYHDDSTESSVDKGFGTAEQMFTLAENQFLRSEIQKNLNKIPKKLITKKVQEMLKGKSFDNDFEPLDAAANASLEAENELLRPLLAKAYGTDTFMTPGPKHPNREYEARMAEYNAKQLTKGPKK